MNSELERRIGKLERGARRWKLVATGLLLVVAALLVMGQTSPAYQRLDVLEIRSDDGRLIRLNSAGLCFFDAEGDNVVMLDPRGLSVSNDTGYNGVVIYSSQGNPAVRLDAQGLEVWDETGNNGVTIRANNIHRTSTSDQAELF